MSKKAPAEFFALVEKVAKDGRASVRQRVPEYISLDRALGDNLATLFSNMADEFFKTNPTVVEFDGRYSPGKGEVFVVRGFKLDGAVTAAAKSPLSWPTLSVDRSPFPQIKALIATENNASLRVTFQEFRTDQIIRQGTAFIQKILHGKNTFDRVDASGIAIGSDVDAVFDGGDLYFRSYYTANRFVDLTPYFKDATDDEIKNLLKTDGIVAEDEEKLLAITDTAMRRKFSIIKKTQILDLVTPEQVQAAAAAQGLTIEIEVQKGKKRLQIPAEKKDAKDVLDFLCQARFISALTNELMVANSYRPIKSGAGAGGSARKKTVKKPGPTKKSAAKRNR